MKTILKILSILLIISFGVIYWLWTHPKIEKEYVPTASKIKPPVLDYSKTKSGNQVVTFKKPQPVLDPMKEASGNLLISVEKINELEGVKIKELTKINTELKLQLSQKDLVVNDAEKQIKIWKDKYNEVSVDNTNNQVSVKSDVSPITVKYTKRPKWFRPKESYVSITSENPFILFNGVETYEVKPDQVKNIFELTANGKVGQYYYDSKIVKGLKFYDASLQLKINPDGTLRPYINAGYRTFDFKGFSPFYEVGLEIPILQY